MGRKSAMMTLEGALPVLLMLAALGAVGGVLLLIGHKGRNAGEAQWTRRFPLYKGDE